MIKFRSLLAVTVLLAAPLAAVPASAQAPQQSLDQYPSFVEFTTTAPDGTQTVLRCGYYSPDGKTVSLDPGFQEISSINSNRGAYARLQHIDDSVIATAPAPPGTLGLQIELVGRNGMAVAKTCQTNTETDTISNCLPSQVNEPAAQVLADDRKLGSQCIGLLQQSAAQIDASQANPQKTETFKAGLRQKVAMLQGK